jgi:hypothetical protein
MIEADSKTYVVLKAALRKKGRFTQAGMSQATGFNKTEVENAFEVLLDFGYIEELGEMGSGTYRAI